MGSWTDTQPPKFAPYIQQQPIEQMVAVGVEKQRRYDEGVRRIQENINRVAGLDIMRPVDKEYLESELDQLGKDLTAVAAGDFSNYQLVNSVSGMASRIAKDPNIINAVKSTAIYRKYSDQMDKDREEGNYNPANEWEFNMAAQEWMNSNTPGEMLKGRYISAVDTLTPLKTVADEVGITMEQVQNLFKTDEKGNISRDEKGNPQWNYLMVEETFKGKDAGKILKAFNSALTPAVYNQLAIEGRYHYRNYTPELLEKEYMAAAEQDFKFYDENIQNLKTEIYKEENKNDTNNDKVDSLKEQLKFFQNRREKLQSSVESSIDQMYENPDAARASLYTNDYLTNMAYAFSSSEKSTKYSVNPILEIMMDLNRYGQKRREGDEEAEAIGLRRGEVRMPIDIDNVNMLAIRFEQGYRNGVDQVNRTNYDIALDFYKETNDRRPGEGTKEFELRMRQEMDRDSGGDIIAYTAEKAAKHIDDWKNGNGIPNKWKGLIESQDELVKILEYKKNVMEDIEAEARARAEVQGLNIPSDEEIKKMVGETTIMLKDNPYGVYGGLKLSAQDMVDFAHLHPSMYKPWKTFGVFITNQEKEKRDEARERLMKKYPAEFEALEYELFGTNFRTFGQNVTISRDRIHPLLRGVINTIASSAYDEYNDIKNEIYKEKGVLQKPISRAITRDKMNTDDFKTIISNVLGKYPGGMDKVKQEELQAAIASDGSMVKIITCPGELGIIDTTHELVVTTKDGERRSLEIDADDYRSITGDEPPESRARPPVIGMLDMRGTTNMLGMDSPDGAWFGQGDFVNFEMPRFALTGDLVSDKYDDAIAWLELYLHNLETGDYEKLTFPGDNTNFRLRKYNKDGSYNMNLPYAPQGINGTTIEQLREGQ